MCGVCVCVVCVFVVCVCGVYVCGVCVCGVCVWCVCVCVCVCVKLYMVTEVLRVTAGIIWHNIRFTTNTVIAWIFLVSYFASRF